MGRRGRRRRRCREPRRGERGAGDDLAGEERSIAAMGVGVDRQAEMMICSEAPLPILGSTHLTDQTKALHHGPFFNDSKLLVQI